jgi:flagellin-like hook-associated protein FlgL
MRRSQRVSYDNAENQLTTQHTYLNSATTQLAQQQNTLGAADLPAAITNLTTAETSRQATLQAVAATSQTNLFNYIK